MVIALVFQYPPSTIPVPQQIDAITKQLESVGAERIGKYSVTCDVAVRAAASNDQQVGSQRGQRTVSLVQHGSYPAACLCVLENGNYAMCDASMRALIGKLDAFNSKSELRAEVSGMAYALSDGDFSVRIGAVLSGASKTVRGILVEVEYGPCCLLSEGAPLLREFALATFSHVTVANSNVPATSSQQLNAALEVSVAQLSNPNSRRNSQAGMYEIVDTLFQYFEHFVLLRKPSSATQPQAVPVSSAPSGSQPTAAHFAGVPQMPSPAAQNSPLTVRR